MKKIIFLLLLVPQFLFAQPSIGYRAVDTFTLDNCMVDVFFNDPLAVLMKKYPRFSAKSDKEKNNLLLEYELNNPLYCFIVTDSAGDETSYVVHGDPAKANTSLHYKLLVLKGNAIDNPGAEPERVIDKLGVMGEFFEHMRGFQNMEKIPDATMIWGYFVRIHPYEEVKKGVVYQIKAHRNEQ